MPEALLQVSGLKTYFYTDSGVVRAVDGVSFSVNAGETLAIVGESGCGKSITSLSIMQLLAKPQGRIVEGEIIFKGENLVTKREEEMRKIRGNEISMIFQEPMTSLNPVYTVGSQIAEAIQLHQKLDSRKSWERAVDMLRLVGIPAPEVRAKQYPHQMSGGMRQRAMIAMALSCNPQLLIADEPTTALDVTIQAQILDLMRRLRDETGSAIILITHDMGVVADMAERVVVMYAGKVVEEGGVVDLFQQPLHPYTQGLLASIPRLDEDTREKLHVIEGVVPDARNLPKGCRFNTRCPYADAKCFAEEPPLEQIGPERRVACWHYKKLLREEAS